MVYMKIYPSRYAKDDYDDFRNIFEEAATPREDNGVFRKPEKESIKANVLELLKTSCFKIASENEKIELCPTSQISNIEVDAYLFGSNASFALTFLNIDEFEISQLRKMIAGLMMSDYFDNGKPTMNLVMAVKEEDYQRLINLLDGSLNNGLSDILGVRSIRAIGYLGPSGPL